MQHASAHRNDMLVFYSRVVCCLSYHNYCQPGDEKLLLPQVKKKKKTWYIMKGVPACICLVEMSLVWFGAQIITEEPLMFLAFDIVN